MEHSAIVRTMNPSSGSASRAATSRSIWRVRPGRIGTTLPGLRFMASHSPVFPDKTGTSLMPLPTTRQA